MRTFAISLFVVIAAIVGWYVGARFGLPAQLRPQAEAIEPDDSNTPRSLTVHGQGKFLPGSGLINIVAPVGERIAYLIDKEIGDTVTDSDVLIRLGSRELREKDLELAKARRKDALNKAKFEKQQVEFKVLTAEQGVDEAGAANDRIGAERKKIVLLEKQHAAAEQLLGRLNSIYDNPLTRDLINQADIDKQKLLVEQLELQIEQANVEIDLAEESAARGKKVAQNALQTAQFADQQSSLAIPNETLNAAIAMAQKAYDMTEIKSPLEMATILDIIVREGDSVTNRPVMVLGDTREMHCVAEVTDAFFGRIDTEKYDQGQLKAHLTNAAFSKPLTGTVISKGVMIGPPSLKNPNPFASVDRRTGTVLIKLDDPAMAAKFVNLQVDVEIEIEPNALKTSESP